MSEHASGLADAPSDHGNTRQPRTSGGGLSELSKQLRVLQAKNTSQTVEIDRLERQLRILADLQGVSVVDLRNALREACEAEAFGEMQHRVASLRAELESVSFTKQSAAAASQEAVSAKRMANLELRVGELEEVEEQQRQEIEKLYSKLMEQQETASRLELRNLQLQSENDALTSRQVDDKAVTEHEHSNALVELQKDNTALKNKALEATMNANTLTRKIKLAERQREALEEQYLLRNTQFKARFMVQEESIFDLEQQLSSLYTAFTLMRDEKAEEDKARLVLKDQLDLADSEVARQVDVLDQSARSTGSNSIFKGMNLGKVMGRPNEPESPIPKSTYVSSTSEIVAKGVLLVKSNLGIIRKWKKRQVVLFSALTHHYLDIAGEGGVELHVGRSRVEPNSKHPFALVVYAEGRMVVQMAALTEGLYQQWMDKLTLATTGDSFQDRKAPPDTSPKVVAEAYPEGAIQRVPSLAEREESDLQMAIEMSQKER